MSPCHGGSKGEVLRKNTRTHMAFPALARRCQHAAQSRNPAPRWCVRCLHEPVPLATRAVPSASSPAGIRAGRLRGRSPRGNLEDRGAVITPELGGGVGALRAHPVPPPAVPVREMGAAGAATPRATPPGRVPPGGAVRLVGLGCLAGPVRRRRGRLPGRGAHRSLPGRKALPARLAAAGGCRAHDRARCRARVAARDWWREVAGDGFALSASGGDWRRLCRGDRRRRVAVDGERRREADSDKPAATGREESGDPVWPRRSRRVGAWRGLPARRVSAFFRPRRLAPGLRRPGRPSGSMSSARDRARTCPRGRQPVRPPRPPAGW